MLSDAQNYWINYSYLRTSGLISNFHIWWNLIYHLSSYLFLFKRFLFCTVLKRSGPWMEQKKIRLWLWCGKLRRNLWKHLSRKCSMAWTVLISHTELSEQVRTARINCLCVKTATTFKNWKHRGMLARNKKLRS